MYSVFLPDMNLSFLFLTFASLLVLNIFVYAIYARLWSGKTNAGLKFLTLNIFKDVAWVVFWLYSAEKTPANLYILMAVYGIFSFIVYRKVIKDLNKN